MNQIQDTTIFSLRTFIGAKNYAISKQFYTEIGFEIHDIDSGMCLIRIKGNLCFYLQNAYVKDWINNSMLFLEVEDLDAFYVWMLEKKLTHIFKGVRITEIRNESWGREFFMHDPSGVLWHFGNFKK